MSGLLGSIKSSQWNPAGSPAVYKYLDYLDAENIEARLVLTDKNFLIQSTSPVFMKGLSLPIFLISMGLALPRFLSRLQFYFSELFQLLIVVGIALRYRPDIVYLDRSNVFIAAFLKRVFRRRVVLRLLGVTPQMHQLKENASIYGKLLRWAYRSPFDMIICTQDGSGGSAWLEKYTPNSLRSYVLLNGTQKPGPETAAKIYTEGKIHLLFVARLEKLKGIREFIQSLGKLSKSALSKYRVSIVGAGAEYAKTKAELERLSLSNVVRLCGAIPHSEISSFLSDAHLFVSLNFQGNLSNVVLEAISYGLGLVALEKAADQVDSSVLDSIISPSSVVNVARENPVQSLVECLEFFSKDIRAIQILQKSARSDGARLASWKERMTDEFELISNLYENA